MASGRMRLLQGLTACGVVLVLAVPSATAVLAPAVTPPQSTSPVDPRVNPIVEENRHLGSELWKLAYEPFHVSDDLNQQIKGYASAVSVNLGESITFYVSANPSQAFTLDLFRMGYYGGTGGRLMQHLAGQAPIQPPCPVQPDTGMVACEWSPTLTFTVPTTWTSGIYLGLLTNSMNYQDYIEFVVRDDTRPADLLYQQGVMTYQAYNNYPNDAQNSPIPATGKSLYKFNSSRAPTKSIDNSRATKASFDRPYSQPGQGSFLDWDVYAVQWLERSGYNVSYTTDVDTHLHGERLLSYKGFISGGHDEYWTKQMYDAVTNARDSGVNLAFFGADAIYWQARLEPSVENVPNRVLVCYRSADLDPERDPALKTLQWRSEALNRPEQTLIGVQYTSGLTANVPFVAINTRSSWVYDASGFSDGDSVPPRGSQAASLGAGIVGYEADRYDPNYPRPQYRSYQLLSSSPFVQSTGQTGESNASIYQVAPGSRAWVFATGTMSWSWALARPNYVDERVQRVTKNVIDRFVAGSILTSSGISRTPARHGDAVTLVATVTNTRAARTTVNVELAVLEPNGDEIPAQVLHDVTLEPSQTLTFAVPWTVPDGLASGLETLVASADAATGGALEPKAYWEANGDLFFIS